MVLEYPHGLAHRDNDAQLAVGIVVGQQPRSPQDKIIRPPSEPGMKLMIHDFRERRRVNLTRKKWLVRRENPIDLVAETIMTNLAKMNCEHDREPYGDHCARGDPDLFQAHRTILSGARAPAKHLPNRAPAPSR